MSRRCIRSHSWKFRCLGSALGLLLIAAVLRAEDPRIAVITTVWYQNSHADVLAGRLLEGYTLDDQPPFPRLKLASLYVDQKPKNDKSEALAQKHGFPVFDSPTKALTLGGDKLAVDGVLLIAEHGKYPESPTGSIQYPKRRMFAELFEVFRRSGRVVPVFCDKHLADAWEDVDWIATNARDLKVPLMAGSSLPGLWRYPPADVERDAPLKEIVACSYHRLDTYGFHALEFVQALAERRAGGETGVKQIRCLEGAAVWKAADDGVFDEKLLNEAVARFKERPLPAGKTARDVVQKPVLFVMDYNDGLRASVLTMDGSNVEWAAAWRYADGKRGSTLFWTQEARPFQHFGFLLAGVEQMMHTGKPTWPAERTVLTSGALDFLLQSKLRGGEAIATPQLKIEYKSDWNWREPPAPPRNRPLDGR